MIFILGCSGKGSHTDQKAILSGTIANITTPEIRLYPMDRTREIKLPLRNGHFMDTIGLSEPMNFYLSNGSYQQQIYLEPGYDLKVNLDGQDSEKQEQFTGKGSKTNTYMTKRQRRLAELEGDFEAFYALEPEAFKKKVDFINDSLERLLDNEKNLPASFKEKERRHIGYWKKLFLKQYPLIHPTKSEYYSNTRFFDSTDLEHPEDLAYSDAFSGNLKYYYDDLIDTLMQKEKMDKTPAHFEVYKKIPDEKIRNFMLFNWAASAITRTEDSDSFRNKFLSISTNENYNDQIAKIYNNLKRTAPGAPSPEFRDYENYAGGTTSLADFRGKYVYIDVWATWCKPCIAEIPALKRLEEKYAQKKIEFVSISIDKDRDHDNWRQMIQDKQMGGIQLFAQNSPGSEFIDVFEVSYIPRFIFIDPDGNIIQSQAPAPSNEKVTALFDSYLNP